MTNSTFNLLPETPEYDISDDDRKHQALLAKFKNLTDSIRLNREEEARLAARPKERQICLKIPTTMLDRLDQIAGDAGISRSQLIRQISSDFLNYVWANRIVFRGSLLGFKHRPLELDQDE